MRDNNGSLFVVSAPSGAGKTTLCQKLISIMPNITHSISHTTRPPRPGEQDGKDYFFLSEDEFRRMAGKGEFAEWAEVHGNLYGTAKHTLTETLKAGTSVILDVDTEGARQLRESFSDGIFIFILPPTMKALRERLGGRMSDSPKEIQRRIGRAVHEIRDYTLYNYVIINNIFEEALKELEAVVVTRGLVAEKVDPEWVQENFFDNNAQEDV